jgi:hypothetical protein
MKGPVHYSRGRVHYTGRLDRSAFEAWAESTDGQSAFRQFASLVRFTLFGKMRAARRRVWRQLTEAVRSEAVVAALQRETDSYLTRLSTLVYAHDLPRVGIDLHRLVVVPRLFANVATDRRIDALLRRQPIFATPNAGNLLRDWFLVTLIDGIEAAVMQARPSLKRPVLAGDGWVVVGVNDSFEWRVPFKGPAWPGHYYLLELAPKPITRAVRNAAAEAIAGLERSLPSLSRVHRNEILRQAWL